MRFPACVCISLNLITFFLIAPPPPPIYLKKNYLKIFLEFSKGDCLYVLSAALLTGAYLCFPNAWVEGWGGGGRSVGVCTKHFWEKVRNVKPGGRLREQVEGPFVFENISEFPFF